MSTLAGLLNRLEAIRADVSQKHVAYSAGQVGLLQNQAALQRELAELPGHMEVQAFEGEVDKFYAAARSIEEDLQSGAKRLDPKTDLRARINTLKRFAREASRNADIARSRLNDSSQQLQGQLTIVNHRLAALESQINEAAHFLLTMDACLTAFRHPDQIKSAKAFLELVEALQNSAIPIRLLDAVKPIFLDLIFAVAQYYSQAKSAEMSLELYRSISKEHREAAYQVGLIYQVRSEREQALGYFRLAADQGHSQSKVVIGQNLAQQIVAQFPEPAQWGAQINKDNFQYLQAAADWYAVHEVPLPHADEGAGAAGAAVEELPRAAVRPDVTVLNMMAQCYQNGLIVDGLSVAVDKEKAIQYARLSAQQNNRIGQYLLGSYLLDSHNSTLLEEARQNLLKEARQNLDACKLPDGARPNLSMDDGNSALYALARVNALLHRHNEALCCFYGVMMAAPKTYLLCDQTRSAEDYLRNFYQLGFYEGQLGASSFWQRLFGKGDTRFVPIDLAIIPEPAQVCAQFVLAMIQLQGAPDTMQDLFKRNPATSRQLVRGIMERSPEHMSYINKDLMGCLQNVAEHFQLRLDQGLQARVMDMLFYIDGRVQQYEGEIAAKNRQIAAAQAEKKAAEEQTTAVQAEKQALVKQVQTAEERAQAVQAEKQAAEKQVQTAEERAQAVQAEKQALVKQVQTAEERAQSVQAEKQALVKQVQTAEERAKAAEELVHDLEKRNTVLTDKVRNVENAQKEAAEKIEKLETAFMKMQRAQEPQSELLRQGGLFALGAAGAGRRDGSALEAGSEAGAPVATQPR